ncbi:LPXTG cell wall anchor domain-containing protein [Clostridium sp. Cult2]|uniref:LPXTG cell wall anchor domain-containing protein n=1 Tax=Clostridium sp. Cult2 TaxID=2079003 RepID=UPI001F025D22|nr:LPXTG cell wall anchor domain-containing protein [Clostridium sp. Cult2]MCF6465490.1 hypothetical protein [Clostridium sp. Cult2]
MKFLNTTKYRISMLVVMIMLLQVLMPMIGDVVWAEELVEPEIVEGQELGETTEEPSEREPGEPIEDEMAELGDSDELETGEMTEEENEIETQGGLTDDFKSLTNVENTDPVKFTEINLVFKKDGEEIKGPPYPLDADVTMEFKFEIGDNVDVDIDKIYTFKIADEIKISENKTIDLLHDIDGNKLGEIEIDEDGTMTIQFLPIINKEYDEGRTGWARVTGKLIEDSLENGGNKEIKFEVPGGTIIKKVEFEKIVETEEVTLTKKGNYDNDKNEIEWTITVNPKTQPEGREISNVKIKDIIQEGQTYIEGTFSIEPEAKGEFRYENETITYDFKEPIKDGTRYTIKFKTKPNLSAFKPENEGNEITFKNKVTGTYGDDNTPTNEPEDSVGTTVNFIKKNGGFVPNKSGNRDDDKITWTIEINNNNLELPSDTKLEDTIPTGLKLIESSIKLEPSEIQYNLTEEGNKFIIKFPKGLDKKLTITYDTRIVDIEAYEPDKTKTYINKATLSWGNENLAESEEGVSLPRTVISKEGIGYDRAEHKVYWTITINENKLDIQNPVVTDILPDELEYVSHTVDKDTWQFEEKGQNLKFSYDGEINDTYTINLVTKIKDEYKHLYGANNNETFKNTVKINGNNINERETGGDQSYISKVIEKTGTGYNYLTREAFWKIVVNENKMKINNAVVVDEILGEFHKFDGELKIGNTASTEGEGVNQYKLEGNKLTINLGNIEDVVTITFKTKIPEDKVHDFLKTNGDKKLENKATLTGDQIKESGESWTGENIIKNTIVGKEGIYQRHNDYIDWEVTINTNQLELIDVKLTDKLQDKLILDTTTVKLYKLIVDDKGKYTPVEDESPIGTKYDVDTNTVEFSLGDIKDAYILKFTTDIDGESISDESFKNEIMLKGTAVEQSHTSKAISIYFDNAAAGGTGSKTRGSIKIVKTDKDTNEKLSNIKFELLDKDKKSLSPAVIGETDENGEILFDDLRMGTYYIREIETPTEYYLIEDTEVELKKGVDTKHIKVDIKNEKIKGNIEFTKYGEDDDILEGAEFTLYHESDKELESPVQVAISNNKGEVKFVDVEYGEYIIIETDPPEGYNPIEPVEVSITTHGETIKINGGSISNTRIRGDFELLKVDRYTNKPLKNAKIAVYTEKDELVEEKTTDETGIIRFENLVYGKYYFKETQAPSGYVRNNEKHPFEIKEDKVVVKVTFENRRIPTDPEIPYEPPTPEGRIKIIKKALGSNELLQDAEFNILNSANRVVGTLKTNSKGEAISNYLPVGTYTIKEVKAPEGYMLNEEIIKKNITDGTTIELVIYNEEDKPEEPENPTEPTEPEDPTDPEDPTIDIDEDGNPKGGTDVDKEDDPTIGLDDNTPKGGLDVDKPTLPKTGENNNIIFYLIGLILIALGFAFRRKTA